MDRDDTVPGFPLTVDSLDDVPRFPLTVDSQDPDPQVFTILEKLRPTWKRGDVKRKRLGETSGMANTIFVYYVTENCDDAIVVRIFGSNFANYVNRERERKACLLLNELAISPKLYGLFENGMCFEFLKGETFDFNDTAEFASPKYARAVAKEIAKMHCKKTTTLAIEKYRIARNDEAIWRLVRVTLEDWQPEKHQEVNFTLEGESPSKEHVTKELENLKRIVIDVNMDLVMSHNDIHPGNVIYNEEEERLYLIDYELCFFNYRGCDLAMYLFYSAFGMGTDDTPPPMHQPDFERDFLRNYLECLSQYENWDREVGTEEVEELRRKVEIFQMYYMLYHVPMICAILQKPINEEINIDFRRSAINAWKLYLNKRKELLGY